MAHEPDPEYALEHEHELEAEYLSATDATVLAIESAEDSLMVDVVVPCPTCSTPLRATSRVEAVVEADVDLPLEDATDSYD